MSGTMSSSKEVTMNTTKLVPALQELSDSLLKLVCLKPHHSQPIKGQLRNNDVDMFSYLKRFIHLKILYWGGCVPKAGDAKRTTMCPSFSRNSQVICSYILTGWEKGSYIILQGLSLCHILQEIEHWKQS